MHCPVVFIALVGFDAEFVQAANAVPLAFVKNVNPLKAEGGEVLEVAPSLLGFALDVVAPLKSPDQCRR